jgi:hypothetical protein
MRWSWIGVALALLVASSGAAQRQDPVEEDRRLGSLLSLVPRGPSWVVRAWPRALAKQQAALALWRAVVPGNLEEAFQKRTGVAPLQVVEAVGCKLPPGGWLIMARGPFAADAVVEHAGERLGRVDMRVEQPFKRREGVAGGSRYTYAALSAYSVLVAKDAPAAWLDQLFARRAAQLAGRPNPKVPGVLEDAAPLLAEHTTAPFVLFAPKPLQFEPRSDASKLFASERALAIPVRPTNESFEVVVDMRGGFPPGVEGRLRAFARSLSSEPLGRLLDVSRVADTMSIRVDDQVSTVTFSVLARELLPKVRAMSFDDVRKMLGL